MLLYMVLSYLPLSLLCCSDLNTANPARNPGVQKIFSVPKIAPGSPVQKLSGLNSIESETAIKKLLLSGRLIKEPKMSPVVKSLLTAERKASLTPLIYHGVHCLALQRHCINMSCFMTSKIGITGILTPVLKTF